VTGASASSPLIVVALGGNALSPPDGLAPSASHEGVLRGTASMLANAALRFRVVITHGNGPQIGARAQQSMRGSASTPSLDVLGAETQAVIGYDLARALALAAPDLPVCCVVTRVEVGADDPSFRRPSKPIGPLLDEAAAEQIRARGWQTMPDRAGLRRAVSSPAPRRIIELEAIRALTIASITTICCGGGGIPVLAGRDGRTPVEGVVDKDLTSALLARELGARQLVLLTDVAAVHVSWPDGRQIARATPAGLAPLIFAPGTMGPKIAAAVEFVRTTGGTAHIGHLNEAEAVIAGTAGTVICGAGPALALCKPK
jgi:carbamate kinase